MLLPGTIPYWVPTAGPHLEPGSWYEALYFLFFIHWTLAVGNQKLEVEIETEYNDPPRPGTFECNLSMNLDLDKTCIVYIGLGLPPGYTDVHRELLEMSAHQYLLSA